MEIRSKKHDLMLKLISIFSLIIFVLGYYLHKKYREIDTLYDVIGWSLMFLSLIILLLNLHKFSNMDMRIRVVESTIQMAPILLVASLLAGSFFIFAGIWVNYLPFTWIGIGIIIILVPFALWAKKTSKKGLTKLMKK